MRSQWREFRASLAARDHRPSLEYTDPVTAVGLSERRIRVQLLSLNLLNAAVALFTATTILGLVGAFLGGVRHFPAASVRVAMLAAGGTGLLFLLAATVSNFLEGACGRAMLGLHLQLGNDLPRVVRETELSHEA